MAQIVEEVKNSQSLGSKMADLYTKQTLLDLVWDIIITVGPKEYRLHKYILGASSEVFHSMCLFGTSEKETPIPLFETEECAEVFDDFIKYLYTGNITLNFDTVEAIITLADKYDVEDLKEIAIQFQKKHEPGNFKSYITFTFVKKRNHFAYQIFSYLQ